DVAPAGGRPAACRSTDVSVTGVAAGLGRGKRDDRMAGGQAEAAPVGRAVEGLDAGQGAATEELEHRQRAEGPPARQAEPYRLWRAPARGVVPAAPGPGGPGPQS